ncbi:MAG TPA: hypothetical protein VFK05_25650 [Polyangiaceae bacterium]|nr:hypothetical protein [Polyangiaceae bacterium]
MSDQELATPTAPVICEPSAPKPKREPKPKPVPVTGGELLARALCPISVGSGSGRADGLPSLLQPGQCTHVTLKNCEILHGLLQRGQIEIIRGTPQEAAYALPPEPDGHDIPLTDPAIIDHEFANGSGWDGDKLFRRASLYAMTRPKSELAGAKDWVDFVKREEKVKRDAPILARIERRAQIFVDLTKEPDAALERKVAKKRAELEADLAELERRAQSPMVLSLSGAKVARTLAGTDEELSVAEKAIRAAELREWRQNARRRLDAYIPAVDAREAEGEKLRPIFNRALAAFEAEDVSTFSTACNELHEALRPNPREGRGGMFDVRR